MGSGSETNELRDEVQGVESSGVSDGSASASFVGSAPYDLAALVVAIPTLYERRKGGEYVDLAPEVEPAFATSDGEKLVFRKGQDYALSFARLDDEGNATPVDAVTERGTYEATLVGIGKRLKGKAVVPFSVNRPLRKGLLTLLVLLSLVGASLGIYMALNAPEAPWYDPNAGEGLAGIHGEDLQELIDSQVDEGMMNITLLDKIIFYGSTLQPGEVGFNNLKNNHYDQKLTLTLRDSDEVLYESGAIQPGQHIQFITLSREFDPGIYPATATITGFNPETHELEATMNAHIEIVVREPEE